LAQAYQSRNTTVPRRPLLGHSRPDRTQLYTDEIQFDELAQSVARALLARNTQASPDLATLESDLAAALQSLEWAEPDIAQTRR
jgi:hypothetical protein